MSRRDVATHSPWRVDWLVNVKLELSVAKYDAFHCRRSPQILRKFVQLALDYIIRNGATVTLRIHRSHYKTIVLLST